MILELYHTTENRGNQTDIIASKGVKATETELFLGVGFYFWEQNFEMAKRWGMNRYKGNYSIFHAFFECNMEKLFNLNLHNHLGLINSLKKSMRKRDMPVGMFIDFLRDFQKSRINSGEITESELFFPFWYAIGEDYSEYDKKHAAYYTSSALKGFYAINPCNFICIYEEVNLTLRNFRHTGSYGGIVNV